MGYQQVLQRAPKIHKNRDMGSGIMDIRDYVTGDIANALDINDLNGEEIIKQNHPLAPPIVNVLIGEFLKRDNKIQVYCNDSETISDKLKYKNDLVNQTISEFIKDEFSRKLQSKGIEQIDPAVLQNPNLTPEQRAKIEEMNAAYNNEMKLSEKLIDSETKFKNYKHRMEEFGQHVINRDFGRFRMHELELDGFRESLYNSASFFHIDLLENDYKVEFLDNAKCFYQKSPNIKYISDGDYFGWFTQMTDGDIINKFGPLLKESDFDTIKAVQEHYITAHTNGIFLTDQEKDMPGAYYDATKPNPYGYIDRVRNEYNLDKQFKNEVANFNNESVDDLINKQRKDNSVYKKLFSVMRAYFKSQRKIGWLVKINKSGDVEFSGWVDETFKVTEKPVYDNSLLTTKTKDNLIYGEHVD
jgi:hypothetical protein